MKKCLIGVFLLAAPLVAQELAQEPAKDQAEIALNAAGCGPSAVSFDVTTDKNQHPLAQPEAGKVLVYVINWVDTTTRVGMDGSWVGAIHYRSYFSFSAEPGDHRVCLNSPRENLRGSALTIKAAAGQTHYLLLSPREQGLRWKLEEIDPARGLFQIASSALSTSHAKR
jgi:hypothetical protein